jgi:hypothetical protein
VVEIKAHRLALAAQDAAALVLVCRKQLSVLFTQDVFVGAGSIVSLSPVSMAVAAICIKAVAGVTAV